MHFEKQHDRPICDTCFVCSPNVWVGRQAGRWMGGGGGGGGGWVLRVCGSVVDRFADTVLYLLQWRLWANSQFVMQYVAVVMNFILRFPWPFVIKAPKVSAIAPNAVARPSHCTPAGILNNQINIVQGRSPSTILRVCLVHRFCSSTASMEHWFCYTVSNTCSVNKQTNLAAHGLNKYQVTNQSRPYSSEKPKHVIKLVLP